MMQMLSLTFILKDSLMSAKVILTICHQVVEMLDALTNFPPTIFPPTKNYKKLTFKSTFPYDYLAILSMGKILSWKIFFWKIIFWKSIKNLFFTF